MAKAVKSAALGDVDWESIILKTRFWKVYETRSAPVVTRIKKNSDSSVFIYIFERGNSRRHWATRSQKSENLLPWEPCFALVRRSDTSHTLSRSSLGLSWSESHSPIAFPRYLTRSISDTHEYMPKECKPLVFFISCVLLKMVRSASFRDYYASDSSPFRWRRVPTIQRVPKWNRECYLFSRQISAWVLRTYSAVVCFWWIAQGCCRRR